MISDEERREVARRLRAAKRPSLIVLMDVLGVGGEGVFSRLADLIEPGDMSQSCRDTVARGIDSIYDWCFERLEGADGAEDELYCSIMSAIEDYRHPERVTARTARPVDRDALLELADEMETADPEDLDVAIDYVTECASRIREACGEEDA